jgi:hypothetical protein
VVWNFSEDGDFGGDQETAFYFVLGPALSAGA